jgi:ribosome biogenesis GTPase A
MSLDTRNKYTLARVLVLLIPNTLKTSDNIELFNTPEIIIPKRVLQTDMRNAWTDLFNCTEIHMRAQRLKNI